MDFLEHKKFGDVYTSVRSLDKIDSTSVRGVAHEFHGDISERGPMFS